MVRDDCLEATDNIVHYAIERRKIIEALTLTSMPWKQKSDDSLMRWLIKAIRCRIGLGLRLA
jgi:hypothetical protein